MKTDLDAAWTPKANTYLGTYKLSVEVRLPARPHARASGVSSGGAREPLAPAPHPRTPHSAVGVRVLHVQWPVYDAAPRSAAQEDRVTVTHLVV